MRIVAGRLGGRTFDSPHGHRTHPMSEKMRGALFNALGDIEGLTVLDAFAGSGALGFEALSRRAQSVTAVESDRSAQRTIAANAASLNVEATLKLIRAGVGAWLETSSATYDIVLADPPYDNPQFTLLKGVAARAKAGGIVVLSLPPQAVLHMPDSFELVQRKDYGDAVLYFYRRNG